MDDLDELAALDDDAPRSGRRAAVIAAIAASALTAGLMMLWPRGASEATSGASPVAAEANGYKVDAIEFNLSPQGGVGYKYQLEQGQTMLFNWTADASISVDLQHQRAVGSREIESVEHLESATGHGVYTAPAAGYHGWFFRNTTDKPVKLVLQTAGFYADARMIYEEGGDEKMALQDPPPPPTY